MPQTRPPTSELCQNSFTALRRLSAYIVCLFEGEQHFQLITSGMSYSKPEPYFLPALYPC